MTLTLDSAAYEYGENVAVSYTNPGDKRLAC